MKIHYQVYYAIKLGEAYLSKEPACPVLFTNKAKADAVRDFLDADVPNDEPKPVVCEYRTAIRR